MIVPESTRMTIDQVKTDPKMLIQRKSKIEQLF